MNSLNQWAEIFTTVPFAYSAYTIEGLNMIFVKNLFKRYYDVEVKILPIHKKDVGLYPLRR